MLDLKFTEEDLTKWIAKNRMLFLFHPDHYTPDYVSYLAITAGFNETMVYKRFAHFDYALALTSIDHAARKKANWTASEFLLRDMRDLSGSWEALGRKLISGLDYDEK